MNLAEAAEQKIALFLPDYMDKYPNDWAEFINYVDHCFKKDGEIHQTEEEKQNFLIGGRVRKGLLQIWGYVTMIAENPTGQMQMFTNLQYMFDKITSDYKPEDYRSSFAILNLSNAENVTNRHNDRTHNMYVQCIGSVVWKIYDSIESQSYTEYLLKPGDAIWVPCGVSHEVVAKEPRSAITIAFHGTERD